MTISAQSWQKYVNALFKVSESATKDLATFLGSNFDYNNPEEMKRLVSYAYGISTKYGEAAAELACQMYDAMGLASGEMLDPAMPADLAGYGDVAKTVYGTAKTSQNIEEMISAVTRLVKQASQDTTLQNALRDGAEFAWIPSGDTCAFCIALASRGWQSASKNAIKKGHAEHIHSNCDCAYAVRFNSKTQVKGYDPSKYEAMYYGADLDGEKPNSKNRINALRREFYAKNKEKINENKRINYAERQQRLNSSVAEETNVN